MSFDIANRINSAIEARSDKDWNYSRILLQSRPLAQINSPYALWVEHLDTADHDELEQLRKEVAWGCRHGDELGILEIVSLRLNKALLESTSDDSWAGRRPVLRLVKKQELEAKGIVEAYWYEVREVCGEDFDSR